MSPTAIQVDAQRDLERLAGISDRRKWTPKERERFEECLEILQLQTMMRKESDEKT